MASVNLQNNPDVAIVGSRDADAVIITSEVVDGNSIINYQIEKISTGEVINVNSNQSAEEGGNLVDVTKVALKIILEFRTDYRVRTKTQFDVYTQADWVNFTTREKRYQSPHAVTQLTDDTDSTSQTQGVKVLPGGGTIAQGGSRTIVVTNTAKGIETDNAAAAYNTPRNWGAATVHNTDTVFADGQLQTSSEGKAVPVLFQGTGARVVNVPAGQNAPIVYTNAGATVNTIRS